MKSIEIEGRKFFLDTDKAVLLDSTDFNNRLPIMEMNGQDDKYWFTINQVTKRFVTQGMEGEDALFKKVEIPHMVAVDPEGIRKKYNISPGTPLPGSDYLLECDKKHFAQRVHGQLPIINIGPWKYAAEGRVEQIRPVIADRNWGPVRYDQLTKINDEYRFLFNMKQGRIIIGESKAVYAGNDMMIVALPDAIHLDPVGYARKHGDKDDLYINYFPVRPEIDAKILKMSHNKSLFQVLRDANLFRPKESHKKTKKQGL